MPVKPPMPNIGIQAEANSIGTGNRIEPRQSDKSRALKIITDGTEMRTVDNEKNELTASPSENASNRRNAATNSVQTKNGSRIQVISGGRSCTMVVMKLIEPRTDDVARKTIPISQKL